jgi:hypothetical protein
MLTLPDAQEVIALWERGAGERPIERILSILAVFTRQSRAVLAALPVHRRDALLLSSRVAAFGTWLEGTACCPQCNCRVEASLNLPATIAEPARDGGSVSIEGQTVTFRVPDSHDLAEALRATDAEEGRQRLLSRCQLSGPRHEGIGRAIEQEIARLCDASSIELSMSCPQCSRDFVIPVDVGVLFWAELTDSAMQLLDDVDVLAGRYGWAEADILAMPERRRRLYLERYS